MKAEIAGENGAGMTEDAGGGLYWLASYPKSGNTWMRAFITALTGEPEKVDINDLKTGEIASSYAWVEEAMGFEIGELSQDEIDRLRPDAYRWSAAQAPEAGYHKIHDAYTYLPDGRPLIPPEAVRGVLYIVRNPLDVAVSFAHHAHCGFDASVRNMGDSAFAFCSGENRRFHQLRQRLLSWSEHVRSWMEAPGLNRLLVRYEDMQARPRETFAAVARFLGLQDDAEAVSRALEGCKMETLQRQEAEKGFREKMPKADRFFRKGMVGDWSGTLTEDQTATIIGDHREMMAALGYLDADGQPAEEIRGPGDEKQP